MTRMAALIMDISTSSSPSCLEDNAPSVGSDAVIVLANTRARDGTDHILAAFLNIATEEVYSPRKQHVWQTMLK